MYYKNFVKIHLILLIFNFTSPRLDKIRQANREIVDWVFILSVGRFPGTVSMTTKSIGDSELRPICNYFLKKFKNSSVYTYKKRKELESVEAIQWT